jgi:N-methylhydantoinase B
MNNVLIGATGEGAFTFYETLGGGEGGSPWRAGMSGVHTHMTNTANTPIESLELEYPLLVRALRLREGTGGSGEKPGGDGTLKTVCVLVDDAVLTILSDSRRSGVRGVGQGDDGCVGFNSLIRDGSEIALPSKFTLPLRKSDTITILTPSGGGWGGQ